jgi:hypothetical protein
MHLIIAPEQIKGSDAKTQDTMTGKLNSCAMRVDFQTMPLVAGFGAGLVTFFFYSLEA